MFSLRREGLKLLQKTKFLVAETPPAPLFPFHSSLLCLWTKSSLFHLPLLSASQSLGQWECVEDFWELRQALLHPPNGMGVTS